METPKIISEYAARAGFNSVSYLKTADNIEYYALGYVDEDGNTPPTGLPFVIEYKDGGITQILDEDVIWDLMSSLRKATST